MDANQAVADAIRQVTAKVQHEIDAGNRSTRLGAEDVVEILLSVADTLDPVFSAKSLPQIEETMQSSRQMTQVERNFKNVSDDLYRLSFGHPVKAGWRENATGVRAVLNRDDECVELFVFSGKHRQTLDYQLRLSLGMPWVVIKASIEAVVKASK